MWRYANHSEVWHSDLIQRTGSAQQIVWLYRIPLARLVKDANL